MQVSKPTSMVVSPCLIRLLFCFTRPIMRNTNPTIATTGPTKNMKMPKLAKESLFSKID